MKENRNEAIAVGKVASQMSHKDAQLLLHIVTRRHTMSKMGAFKTRLAPELEADERNVIRVLSFRSDVPAQSWSGPGYTPVRV